MRKQAEKHVEVLARREAQSRMNEFLAAVSHELKTPLTSIKGNVQLLRRRLKSALKSDEARSEEAISLIAEMRDLLERTEQQINRLAFLLNTLLEGARISSNTFDLLTELSELNTLVREVLQDSRYVPEKRAIHVEMPAEKALLVMADPVRIKQVIVHYLSNAHRYSSIEHPIEVYLEEEGNVARFSVRDEGPGIPQKEQKHIWERYYRIPGTKVRNGSEVGLGLGLHISRAIIEQHRGQVGVISRDGSGSIFWFTLPIHRTQVSPSSTPEEEEKSEEKV